MRRSHSSQRDIALAASRCSQRLRTRAAVSASPAPPLTLRRPASVSAAGTSWQAPRTSARSINVGATATETVGPDVPRLWGTSSSSSQERPDIVSASSMWALGQWARTSAACLLALSHGSERPTRRRSTQAVLPTISPTSGPMQAMRLGAIAVARRGAPATRAVASAPSPAIGSSAEERVT